jgi:hypothetical protein
LNYLVKILKINYYILNYIELLWFCDKWLCILINYCVKISRALESKSVSMEDYTSLKKLGGKISKKIREGRKKHLSHTLITYSHIYYSYMLYIYFIDKLYITYLT